MKTYPRVRELLQQEVKKFQSVNQVALKTGLTNNTIGKYMDGISEPQTETLEKLSQYFKKPVAWLRGDDDVEAIHGVNHESALLSSLSIEQREAWDLLQQLPPVRRKKAVSLLKLLLSDE